MHTVKFLVLCALFSILPGQLIRVSLGSFGAINLSDIVIVLCDIFFVLYWLLSKKTLKVPSKMTYVAILFIFWSLTSTILAANFFSPFQIIIALSFLIRFAAYFFFTIVVFNVTNKASLAGWVNALLYIGAAFTIIGFFQILILPDLSFLAPYGWDPHNTRITSTLLDPNFTGGLITIFFSISLCMFIFKKGFIYIFLASIFFAAIILTFSRSSYLALLSATSIIGLVKSPKALIVALLVFIISFTAIPQVRNRIVGALTLDETAVARIESWQRGWEIFSKNPVFGVGFNTYRFVQEKYGNFNFDSPEGGHSGAGSDSSILLVAATTGVFGFILYLALLFSIFLTVFKNIRENYINLATVAALSALIIHSQFVNSLFFPQIMLPLFFIIGLSAKRN